MGLLDFLKNKNQTTVQTDLTTTESPAVTEQAASTTPLENSTPAVSSDTFVCASCKREFPKSDAVERLHGAVLVCKECDDKEKGSKKDGETCEFC